MEGEMACTVEVEYELYKKEDQNKGLLFPLSHSPLL